MGDDDDSGRGIQKPSLTCAGDDSERLMSIWVPDVDNSSAADLPSAFVFVCLLFAGAFEEEGLRPVSDCRRFEPMGSTDLVDDR